MNHTPALITGLLLCSLAAMLHAADPAYVEKLGSLRESLMSELKKQNDPRALGQGDVFDQYLSPRAKTAEGTPEKKKNKKAEQ